MASTLIFAILSGLVFFLGLRTTGFAIVELLGLCCRPRALVRAGLGLGDVDQNGGSSEAPPGAGVAHGSLSKPPPPEAPPEAPPPEAPPPEAPPPENPPPPPERWARVTLADAYRREGPTSSTWSSTTVRFSPSRVSYERWTSLPCTITRIPLVRDSATFSAASRQTEQRMNSVSLSFHSLLCLSKLRGVDATVKFATAAPDGVKRSSGSPVRFPTTVMTVSPAMPAPRLCSDHAVVGAALSERRDAGSWCAALPRCCLLYTSDAADDL